MGSDGRKLHPRSAGPETHPARSLPARTRLTFYLIAILNMRFPVAGLAVDIESQPAGAAHGGEPRYSVLAAFVAPAHTLHTYLANNTQHLSVGGDPTRHRGVILYQIPITEEHNTLAHKYCFVSLILFRK